MWLTRLFFIVLWGTITALLMNKPQVPQEFPVVDSALLSFSPSKQTADTTAVILNWSRFPNVVRIVSLLCHPKLENTLASIHIWNNSPNRILKEDFAECPPDRLLITNSPSNLYFQARFLACAEATTPFCFIQDDDYLVLPEIIQTLRSRFSNDSVSTIYLSPPHEVMSTILKRIHVKYKIHTSFAWLGYGAIMRRRQAQDFLALMQYLNVSEDEMKMADNYYALLANVYPEVWFDQGIELGGGQAFTQGAEGDERNNKHIAQAANYLDQIINCTSTLCISQPVPFTSLDDQLLSSVYRAPCVGSQCLLETNISLLPSTQIDVDSANRVLEIEKINRNSFKLNDTKDFLLHPPSHAVDGNPQTGFCIPKGVRKGDTIEIDLLGAVAKSGQAEVVFLVDRDVRSILIAAATLQFRGNDEWFESRTSFTCVSKEDDLHECSAPTPLTRFSAFRIFFNRAVERRGCLQEIWMRER